MFNLRCWDATGYCHITMSEIPDRDQEIRRCLKEPVHGPNLVTLPIRQRIKVSSTVINGIIITNQANGGVGSHHQTIATPGSVTHTLAGFILCRYWLAVYAPSLYCTHRCRHARTWRRGRHRCRETSWYQSTGKMAFTILIHFGHSEKHVPFVIV